MGGNVRDKITAATKDAVTKTNLGFETRTSRLRRRLRACADDLDKAKQLESELRATVAQWQTLKRRRLEAKHVWTHKSDSRAFFERVSMRRTVNAVTYLDDTPGAPRRLPSDLANSMADGWKATFTQSDRRTAKRVFTALPTATVTADQADVLAAPITASKVLKSIKRCKQTKSGGPDQLPNAWYRDFAELLVPILHKLFQACFDAGATPASFQEATIVALPKAGPSTKPLGYRPMALLNTDYKLYSRVFAGRARPVLPTVIASTQCGFVPGRDIHDVIDVFTAAQHHATKYDLPTVAVLLDIQKAYDSLDRQYLDECLAARGFPSSFRAAMRAMHVGTTARFNVNGFLSMPIAITRGIRQGCPIAPLLFILAIDPLYYAIQAEEALRGSPLDDLHGFVELPPAAMTWYLGCQVGSAVAVEEIKTHSVAQRAALAHAIVVPKILFIARHHWPTRTIVEELDRRIQNFVWNGLFLVDMSAYSTSQRWAKRHLASLPGSSGGLKIPVIRHELVTMATMVVARWAYEPMEWRHQLAVTHGRIQPDCFLQPWLQITDTLAAPQYSPSMWRSGEEALCWVHRTRLDFATQLLVRGGISALQIDRSWHGKRGELERDYSSFYRIGGRVIMDERQTAEGRLNPSWIRHLPIDRKRSSVLWQDGSLLTTQKLTCLGSGANVGDYVSWEWVGPVWCSDQMLPTVLRAFNVDSGSGWEWSLSDTTPPRLLTHDHGVLVHDQPRRTQRELMQAQLVRVNDVVARPQLEPSPTHVRLVQVWAGFKAWAPQRRRYKRALLASSHAKGQEERDERAARWLEDDAVIAAVLGRAKWHNYLATPGQSTYDNQLWHRLRLRQLQAWHTNTSSLDCGHPDCTTPTEHGSGHTFWRCAAAPALWQRLALLWGATHPTAQVLCEAVFGRAPPPTTKNWCAMVGHDEPADSTQGDRIVYWLQVAWSQLVTTALKRLWKRQFDHMATTLDAAPGDDYFAVWGQWSRHLRTTMTAITMQAGPTKSLDATIQHHLVRHFTMTDHPVPRFALTLDQYLLFFDGGSRGNPGPGGSGSVISASDLYRRLNGRPPCLSPV